MVVCALAIAPATGCYLAHGQGTDGSGDAGAPRGMDAGPPTPPTDAGPPPRPIRDDGGPPQPHGDGGPPTPQVCTQPVGVDLLLVLDDSGSFRPDDSLLADRLSRMMRQLVRPPDRDGDGVEDWPRVEDLHVGIVSTSVRGPEFCSHVADGALRRGAGAPFSYCTDAPYPAFQVYDGAGDPERLIEDVLCVTFGPRDGCQIEQPLEAMAKALLPSSAPFVYTAGRARGDVENAGFLRPDSALVVLVFTDEDDCSVRDPSIFEPPDAGPAIPFRDAGPSLGAPGCRAGGDGLYDVGRYLDALRFVRPAHPERVVFGFVAAIDAPFIDRFGGPLGSCIGGDYPGRLVDLASAMPGRSLGGSMCRLSELTFVHSVASRIGGLACED